MCISFAPPPKEIKKLQSDGQKDSYDGESNGDEASESKRSSSCESSSNEKYEDNPKYLRVFDP